MNLILLCSTLILSINKKYSYYVLILKKKPPFKKMSLLEFVKFLVKYPNI